MRKLICVCFVLLSCASKNDSNVPIAAPSTSAESPEKLTETPPAPAETLPSSAEPQPEVKDDIFDAAIKRLWRTPLGVAFHDFMFSPKTKDEVEEAVESFSLKLFSNERITITRLSLLQLLSENLHEHGQLTDEATKRLLLLQGRVSLYRVELNKPRVETVTTHAAAILGGSFVLEAFRSGGFIRSFKIGRAFSNFFHAFGAYSVLYFIWFDWEKAPSGIVIDNELLLYDFDRATAEAAYF